MKSKLFSLNVQDVIKSAILAGITIFVSSLTDVFSEVPPRFPTGAELLATLKLAGTTAGLYLLKNIFTNSDDKIFKKEEKQSQ